MRRIRVHTNVRAMIMPNKILDKPKLITFDLDHTLWNPDHALQRGEAASAWLWRVRGDETKTSSSPSSA